MKPSLSPRHDSESFLNLESLEDRMMLSTVQIIAAGVEGSELMRLQTDGSDAQTWTLGTGAYQGQTQNYTYDTPQTVSSWASDSCNG